MKKHEESVKAREGMHGPLMWYLGVSDNEKSGEVLFGRMVALYDHVTNNLSLLQIYADPNNREIALTRIGHWYEEQSKRVRLAYSTICLDCKGMGKKEILSDNFDIELFSNWYALEKNALASNDLLKKVLHKVWGGNIQDMLEALSIPGKVFQNVNTWTRCMGPDMTSCLKAAFIALIQSEQGYKLLSGDDWDSRESVELFNDTLGVREEFARAWKAKEDELLALPSERRSEAWKS